MKTNSFFKRTIDSMVDWFTRSILNKVTLAVFSSIIFMNLGYAFCVKYVNNKYITEHVLKQLNEKVASQNKYINDKLATTGKIVTAMTSTNSLIRDEATKPGEYSQLENFLRHVSKDINANGFVILDREGNILRTSFANYSKVQAEELRRFTLDYLCKNTTPIYNGNLRVLNQGPCCVTAQGVRDTTGTITRYVILSQMSLTDNRSLYEMTELTGTPVSIYIGNTCMASSASTKEKDMIGTAIAHKWVPDSLLKSQEIINVSDEMNGTSRFCAYEPIRDYKDSYIGCSLVTLDSSILQDTIGTASGYIWISGLVIGLLLIYMCRTIFGMILVTPLERVQRSAERIADGDLTENLNIEYPFNDEVMRMGEAVRRMQETVTGTITHVIETSKVVSASSAEMNKASQLLSSSANNQAASLEEIASSLEEMSSMIHQTADNAFKTQNMVASTGSSVTAIAQAASSNVNTSKKISGSIKNINKLVNQTNILALNASVEAARAGSAGKGFSVIAKEVGRLADQTRHVSMGVTDTVAESTNGIDNINGLLTELMPQLEGVVEIVEEMNNACKEQSIGADQINTAVAGLNKVTQENAANAEEIAANAQELANTANTLKKLVNGFKCKED